MEKGTFNAWFVLGPLLSAGIMPTLLFGPLTGQWGSNILWGSYFGLGWCLAAFASGGLIHNNGATIIGFAWSWFAALPLYGFSDRLWRSLDVAGRARALRALKLSLLLIAPGQTLFDLDAAGVHLPDYMAHLAGSF